MKSLNQESSEKIQRSLVLLKKHRRRRTENDLGSERSTRFTSRPPLLERESFSNKIVSSAHSRSSYTPQPCSARNSKEPVTGSLCKRETALHATRTSTPLAQPGSTNFKAMTHDDHYFKCFSRATSTASKNTFLETDKWRICKSSFAGFAHDTVLASEQSAHQCNREVLGHDHSNTSEAELVRRSWELKASDSESRRIDVFANQPRHRTKLVVEWRCMECDHECFPVREQSRCLCGHRLKDHPLEKKADGSVVSRCSKSKCRCDAFNYIVAEGAWVLRCRCKHKGIDHNPASSHRAKRRGGVVSAGVHPCEKKGCECVAFDSPWVCNCNHAWRSHKQRIVEKKVKTLEEMLMQADTPVSMLGTHDQVKRTNLLENPVIM